MKITEKNFIEQLKIKNEKALEFMLEKYGWIIKTVAKKHLQQCPQLIDECLNDVLLAVWLNIESFDTEKNTFQNWLSGVSRYKAIDCKRKYLKNLNEEPLENAEQLMDSRSTVSFLKQETLEELNEILSCLNQEDRGIFKKIFWEGESVKLVSKTVGMKESIIYNRVSRGRKKIREHLSITGKENIL